jgi:hypothetical protein
MLSRVLISEDDIDSDGRTLITSVRIGIKHMQNGINSGCSASSVKCQVSNHSPVGGAGKTEDGLEACAHLHMSQTHLA